jgi:Zn ribbon nucleic-acid-binding protein
MARLSVAQGPFLAVLPTVHGCHYAFQKFPMYYVTLYNENPSSGRQIVSCGQTDRQTDKETDRQIDRHDKANGLFS